MTEKGDPMLLIGLLTSEVTGGSEVMEAAGGTRAGDCFPEGGDDTEELSGLRESGKKKKHSLFYSYKGEEIKTLYFVAGNNTRRGARVLLARGTVC